jgi:serine protease AprX
VVVAAVGNNGDRPGYVVPPASVPAVISVGGVNDFGDPALGRLLPYRSSHGPTIDGVQKPEIITLADFIAAPILPGTPTAREAALLATLDATEDQQLSPIIARNRGLFAPLDAVEGRPAYLIRQVIAAGLHDGSVIDEHYKRVDGTSFAAPIVTSVVAQMLEANPRLTPGQVKRLLLKTAERVSGIDVDRQGWGVVRPRQAVEAALTFQGQ